MERKRGHRTARGDRTNNQEAKETKETSQLNKQDHVSFKKRQVRRMEQPITIPKSNVRPTVGGTGQNRTILAKVCDRTRDIWILDSGAETITAAAEEIGLDIKVTMQSDTKAYWRDELDMSTMKGVQRRMAYDETRGTDWIVLPRMQDIGNRSDTAKEVIHETVYDGEQKQQYSLGQANRQTKLRSRVGKHGLRARARGKRSRDQSRTWRKEDTSNRPAGIS
jgi:hypothetical protein